MGIASKSIFYAKILVIITLNNKKGKIENNDSETSIIKNSLLLAMLLNIAKAFSYEMLQCGENKAYAHNEVISVLLRHAQRHSGKFLFWMLSLELHEKTLGSQNYAYVFVKNEMNIFLLILPLSRN